MAIRGERDEGNRFLTDQRLRAKLKKLKVGALSMNLSARSKGTILLLCSDPDILAVLQDMLEGAGYVVLPASDLGSAVDRLREATPDLLIVRPHLEAIAGHEAALYLRTRCNGLRVLMAGGLPDDDRITIRESLQSVEIFPKPFTAAEFLEKVGAVLAAAPTKRI